MAKSLKVSEDIVPIAQFKGSAGRLLRQIQGTGQHLVITQNGRAAGVVMSPQEYDRMRYRQDLLEEIAAGIADVEQGRTVSTTELRRELKKARAQQRKR